MSGCIEIDVLEYMYFRFSPSLPRRTYVTAYPATAFLDLPFFARLTAARPRSARSHPRLKEKINPSSHISPSFPGQKVSRVPLIFRLLRARDTSRKCNAIPERRKARMSRHRRFAFTCLGRKGEERRKRLDDRRLSPNLPHIVDVIPMDRGLPPGKEDGDGYGDIFAFSSFPRLSSARERARARRLSILSPTRQVKTFIIVDAPLVDVVARVITGYEPPPPSSTPVAPADIKGEKVMTSTRGRWKSFIK